MSSPASKYFPDEKAIRSDKTSVFYGEFDTPIWLILTDRRVAGLKRLYYNPITGFLPYIFKRIASGKWAFNIPLTDIAEVRQFDKKALIGLKIPHLLIKDQYGKEYLMARGARKEFINSWITDIHEAMTNGSA